MYFTNVDPAVVLKDPLVRLEVAFYRALLDVQASVVASFGAWCELTGLKGSVAMIEERLKAGKVQRRPAVDGVRLIREFMNTRFPEYEEERHAGEYVPFRKKLPLNESIALVVTWILRQNFGLTPSLDLTVGLKSASGPPSYPSSYGPGASVPKFFGRGDTATWVYQSKAELLAALDSGARFLEVVLPEFEAKACTWLTADERLVDGVGAVSAREAVEALEVTAIAWGLEQALTQVVSAGSPTTQGEVLPVSSSGRLEASASWNLSYGAADGKRQAVGTVPFAGPILWWPCDEPEPWRPGSQVGEVWLDSDAALETARGAVSSIDWPLVDGMILQGPDRERGHKGSWWHVGFRPADLKKSLSVSLDAKDGRVLEVKEYS